MNAFSVETELLQPLREDFEPSEKAYVLHYLCKKFYPKLRPAVSIPKGFEPVSNSPVPKFINKCEHTPPKHLNLFIDQLTATGQLIIAPNAPQANGSSSIELNDDAPPSVPSIGKIIDYHLRYASQAFHASDLVLLVCRKLELDSRNREFSVVEINQQAKDYRIELTNPTSTLNHLCSKELLEVVSQRPKKYLITEAGRQRLNVLHSTFGKTPGGSKNPILVN